MNVFIQVIKEIKYRKANFVLTVLAVALAVSFYFTAIQMVRVYDLETESIVKQKEESIRKETAVTANDYRKITKDLGFNILILPKSQNLSDFYADDFAIHDMPEEYAQKLAETKIITVTHLLPSLSKKIFWPEKKRTIILTGIRGELLQPHKGGKKKKPILRAVPVGKVVVGFELARSLKLKKGDAVPLFGKNFIVEKSYKERGNSDDITLWINLDKAQKILKKRGRINAILALECRCSTMGNLANIAKIREDIAKILPKTKVIEFMSQAITRAEARYKVIEVSRDRLESERKHRLEIKREWENHIALLMPFIFIASALFVALLTFGNTRRRKTEIGILNAMGISSSKIFNLFLGKAFLTGLIGTIFGSLLGTGVSLCYIYFFADKNIGLILPEKAVLLQTIFIIPILVLISAWLPVYQAVTQNPADILQEE